MNCALWCKAFAQTIASKTPQARSQRAGFLCYNGNTYFEKNDMSFKKMHKKAYYFWVVISTLVVISMIMLSMAPLFFY